MKPVMSFRQPVLTFIPFALLLAGAALPAAAAVDVKLTAEGVSIGTPSEGPFVLTYPVLLDKADKQTRPGTAALAKGGARMDYPGGGRMTATLEGDKVMLHFTELPAAAHGLRMDMTLPIAWADGGTWQMEGEPSKSFPSQFAGEQFVFKGNPRPVKLVSPQGAAFTLSMPHGWQQMQDNRMWNNNKSFGYMVSAQMPGEAGGEAYYTFQIVTGRKKTASGAAAARPVRTAPRPSLALRLAADGVAIDAGEIDAAETARLRAGSPENT